MNKTKAKSYSIYLDDRELNIYVEKISNFEEKMNKMVSLSDIEFRNGFLFQGQKTLNTLLLRYNVDIVVANYKHQIIDVLESFKTNSLTKKYDNSAFIYVFPENTIKHFKINKSKNIKHYIINENKKKW